MNSAQRVEPQVIGIVIAGLICTIGYTHQVIGEENTAPFTTASALQTFSETLMRLVSHGDVEQAERLAVANSHLDDPITQQNLADAFDTLKETLRASAILSLDYVQTSKFGRSFLRHQYALENADVAMRCMLTYRRKTAGWRLNQLWCH